MRRFNLVVPDPLWDEVEAAAETEHVTVTELLRRYMKLGLWVLAAHKRGAQIIVREEGQPDTHIQFL